jgi:hypothetical protein
MTRTPPSVLLSEGYCPIGHGPLHRSEEDGWCAECGLRFSIRAGPVSPKGWFVRYALMQLPDRCNGWGVPLSQLDDSMALHRDLLYVYNEMVRTDDHTQWRMEWSTLTFVR